MKSKIIFFIFFIFFLYNFSNLSAQDDPAKSSTSTENFQKHLFTGGSIGLQFGIVTLVDLSPLIGYKITKNFSAGIGATYQYCSAKDYQYGYTYKTSIYGGRVFARYYFLKNFLVDAEYESLSLESKYFDLYQIHNTPRFLENNLFAGGGYRQIIGENSCFYIMILYNLNETIDNHYGSPYIIRTGVEIGF
jgi:hypothetical protein